MTLRESLAGKIRRGEPIPFVLSAALSTLTPAWRLGMWTRLKGRRFRVDANVISFGNLTAGGTGKTPAVIERARREVAAGSRVAVLTRGYGSRPTQETLVFQGRSGPIPVEDFGDEPALMARKVPEALIVKGADRVEAARAAIEEGCDTLILDDGFQYVRLERDENILLIDASNPFGNGALLPRGVLREPLSAMSRATEIVLTRCDQAKDLEGLDAVIANLCPDLRIRRTVHRPTGFRRLADGAPFDSGFFSGTNCAAACALGNPEAFFTTLEGLGVMLISRHAFPDHGQLSRDVLMSDDPVLVSEKDGIRIPDPPDNIFVLEVELDDWRS